MMHSTALVMRNTSRLWTSHPHTGKLSLMRKANPSQHSFAAVVYLNSCACLLVFVLLLPLCNVSWILCSLGSNGRHVWSISTILSASALPLINIYKTFGRFSVVYVLL